MIEELKTTSRHEPAPPQVSLYNIRGEAAALRAMANGILEHLVSIRGALEHGSPSMPSGTKLESPVSQEVISPLLEIQRDHEACESALQKAARAIGQIRVLLFGPQD